MDYIEKEREIVLILVYVHNENKGFLNQLTIGIAIIIGFLKKVK